jgi:uncharacterized protein (DUF2141 family)
MASVKFDFPGTAARLAATAGILTAAAFASTPTLAQGDSLIDLYGGVESGPPPDLSGLNLRIEGIANASGKIVAMVYDDAGAYSTYNAMLAVASATLDAVEGTLDTNFAELTEGPYAVFLFHDENGDFELNSKQGFPLEGYGYSGQTDPHVVPTFAEAATTGDHINVTLVYLGKVPVKAHSGSTRAPAGPFQQRREPWLGQ